jgi:muramoyltetrapeptide carboxypeptidase
MMKAQMLTPGQTIGLVAPSSPSRDDDDIRMAGEVLESLGFRVKESANLYHRHGYLAGSDAERAADLNAMFADERVAAIFALHGGYGASRLLPLLDYDLIRHHPKVLLGYSDITALLNGIYTQTGLITFHGKVAASNFTDYSLAEFKKVLLGDATGTIIGAAPPFDAKAGQVDRENRLVRVVPGKAQGHLIGGNLTLLSHLIGTPYAPDFGGKLLFLEDVGESVYRIDRMLTQLLLAGALQRIAGIVLGKFTDCKPVYSSGSSLRLTEVLEERCGNLGIPVLRGLMIGHIDDQTVVPVGSLAELDVDAGTLQLMEAPCSSGASAVA